MKRLELINKFYFNSFFFKVISFPLMCAAYLLVFVKFSFPIRKKIVVMNFQIWKRKKTSKVLSSLMKCTWAHSTHNKLDHLTSFFIVFVWIVLGTSSARHLYSSTVFMPWISLAIDSVGHLLDDRQSEILSKADESSVWPYHGHSFCG